jgi:hypothetical protein
LVAAPARAQNIPVRNPGFESSSGRGAADWTVAGATGPRTSAGLDQGLSHADNALIARLAPPRGIDVGKNFFRWQGKTYGEVDDGLFVAMPNPWNSSRVVYMFLGNSALEVYQMTKRFQGLRSWGVWKGDQVTDRGYFSPYYPAAGLSPEATTSLR